jgi:uncharacterized protein YycO
MKRGDVMSMKKKVSIILVALTMCVGLFVSPAKAARTTNYAEEIAALPQKKSQNPPARLPNSST